MIQFPISGVETHLWLPPLVGFVLAFLAVPAGVSGAFMLLPFQVSVLGFSSPAVSGTNLIFNLVSIPGSLLRYLRGQRTYWGVSLLMLAGTLPGMALGVFARGTWLVKPDDFKLFAGFVLLLLAIRMMFLIFGKRQPPKSPESFNQTDTANRIGVHLAGSKLQINGASSDIIQVPIAPLFFISLVVGVVGGAYGIGGGAFLAPVLVGIYRMPVRNIAGATLLVTFISSLFGALAYNWLLPLMSMATIETQPDWALGVMFGIGGLVGGYFGARIQPYLPEMAIKTLLTAMLLFVSLRYIYGGLF